MNIVELDGYAANPGDLSWEALKAFGNLTEGGKSVAVLSRRTID